MCWNKGRLCWKIAKLFYFCHLKKLVRPETFGPYYVSPMSNIISVSPSLKIDRQSFITETQSQLATEVRCILTQLVPKEEKFRGVFKLFSSAMWRLRGWYKALTSLINEETCSFETSCIPSKQHGVIFQNKTKLRNYNLRSLLLLDAVRTRNLTSVRDKKGQSECNAYYF